MVLPQRPRVGIVMPTANPAKYPASEALRIVRATTAHLDVDLQVVQSSGPDFRLSRSVNRGMAQAKDADAFALLNDDAFMDAGWLDALLDASRARPEVGVWGAHLRYPDGRIQHAGGHITLSPGAYFLQATAHKAPFWAIREMRKQGFREHPYMFAHYRRFSTRNRLDYVTGAVQLVTRACHERIGSYDEDYFFGSEDIDYALRAREAGFEIGFAARATGIHLDRGTGSALAERAKASDVLFRERWSAARIRKATRGRVGVYVE